MLQVYNHTQKLTHTCTHKHSHTHTHTNTHSYHSLNRKINTHSNSQNKGTQFNIINIKDDYHVSTYIFLDKNKQKVNDYHIKLTVIMNTPTKKYVF